MITNFELHTAPLTENEKSLVPLIIKGLNLRTRPALAIKGNDICRRMNEQGYKLTEPRLRKITNFLRSAGILPVIATSKGYYISYNKEEIEKQIQSLQERKEAIEQAIQGMKKFIK